MKHFTIFCFVALVVVAVVSSLAAEDSKPALAESQPVSGRNGAYAQWLPRLSSQQETVENDMQHVEAAYDQTENPTGEPIRIDTGFVIFDGRYISPPYAVRSDRGMVHINGLKVQQRRPGPFPRRPPNMPQPNRGPHNRRVTQIERHLREDAMLICSQDNPVAYISAFQAVSVLEILLSDDLGDNKMKRLLKTDTPWITSEQWTLLIETFNAPVELSDRVQALKQRQAELAKEDTEHDPPWIFLSSITYSGFILAVWALGTLLSCRPPLLKSSRAVVLSQKSCRQVIWLVVLFAVLNMYDLTCTVFANNMGSLWELNPFASPIIHDNSGIIIFKLSLTFGVAILFLVARRHRLAQIGSWWAGVVYTVLILRWATFNTMFM